MGKVIVLLVVSVMAVSSVGFVLGESSSAHSSDYSAIQGAASLLFGTSTTYSTNWAGYAVTGSGFTSVTGSFVVPAISTSSGSGSTGGHGNGHGKGSPNIQGLVQLSSTGLKEKPGNGHGGGSGGTTYAAFWAGLDGYNSNTVEQAGVLMTDSNGLVSYQAWTEFYPAAPVYATWQPTPGDHIVVYVNYTTANNTFHATVKDTTSGNAYSNWGAVSGATRSSAEWIAEAPSSSSGVLPLANFGTVSFGYDNTSITGTNYASLGGASQPIGSFPTIYQINMEASPVSLKATTSALSSDGTSFNVTWVSS